MSRRADPAHPSADLLAESEREEAIAREYLERRQPEPDPISELPEVEKRIVHEEPPELRPEGERACDAVGRMVVDPPGSPALPNVVDRREVHCRLPPGHAGPHMVKSRWELPRTWSVWAWDEGGA